MTSTEGEHTLPRASADRERHVDGKYGKASWKKEHLNWSNEYFRYTFKCIILVSIS